MFCSALLHCVDRRQTRRSLGQPISEIRPAQLRRDQFGAADLPEGFAEEVVATGITGATAMAVAPDGRVFVCEQTGALRIVKDDVLLPEPFVTVKVDSSWERGLIGVALDPGFSEAALRLRLLRRT